MAFISSRKSFLKAAASGDVAEVQYCLSYKTNSSFSIDVKDAEGRTALSLAAENGRIDVLKMLIDARANLEIANEKGETPLLAAARANKTAAARMLIAAGADVNTHDVNYVTPIISAAYDGQIDVVQDLVAAKADINAVSKASGRTALHWAVEFGHVPLIEYLISQNARMDIADRKGLTPLGVAEVKAQPHILKLLKAAPKEEAFVVPAATSSRDGGEAWVLMGSARVAHVGDYPALNRKITEIFNFEGRERIIITENLKTGAETTTQPEKFEMLAEDAVARAEEQLKALGGAVPDKSQKKQFNL